MRPSAPDPSASRHDSHGGDRVRRGRPRGKKNLLMRVDCAILPGMKAGQLTQLREQLRLTVAEFADLIGVSPRAVYQWEAGERTVRGRAVKQKLEDLWDRCFGPPWDRERARLEVAKRLGVDLDRAGQLLTEYGHVQGEPWRDVAGRVVDGERFHKLGRVAEG